MRCTVSRQAWPHEISAAAQEKMVGQVQGRLGRDEGREEGGRAAVLQREGEGGRRRGRRRGCGGEGTDWTAMERKRGRRK